MSTPTPLRIAWAASYTLDRCADALFKKALGRSDAEVRACGKAWAEGFGERFGIEVLPVGLDRVDWAKPAVVMANHQSYLDVFALWHALPRVFGFVAKRALFKIPLFGGVMRAVECVPVDRDRKAEAIRAMRDAAEQVRRSTIVVFPEGTRSAGDRIGPFKKGAFYLAQVAQVPVVPIGIRGSAALMPRSNSSLGRGTIEVHVGDPIAAITSEDPAARSALMERSRVEIGKLAALPLV